MSFNWQAASGAGLCVETERVNPLGCTRVPAAVIPCTLEPGIASREGGHIYEGVSGTLRAKAGDNQMTVAYAVGADLYNVAETGDKAATLTTQGGGTASGPSVICAFPIHDQATRFSGKRGDKSDGKGNGLGVGQPGDPMNTLTAGDRHAVAYQESVGALCARDYKGVGSQYADEGKCIVVKEPSTVAYGIGNGQANQGISEERVGALNCMHDQQAVAYSFYPQMKAESQCLTEEVANCIVNGTNPGYQNGVIECRPSRYIVRRLIPTECARLQGFADRWGWIEEKKALTEEEFRFWLEVRNTHARINGKKEQEYTAKQMLTWYNKLWTDSSEYKMWGNGIALPTALYCIQGMAEVLARPVVIEDDDDWML